jgi:GGDEF domain-containing protein
LGLLLALSALSGVRYLEHGNQIDAGALLYGTLTLLTVAQFNGVLNVFLWAEVPALADYAYAVIPVIGVGVTLLFSRELCALSTRYPRYNKALHTVGWSTITSVVAYLVFDRQTADGIVYSAMVLASSMALLAALLSWRSHSPIWTWLLLAYIPHWLVLMRLLAEAYGLVPTYWEMRYVMSFSMALSVPVLLYALSRATHDRKELAFRANHLPTQDALTGLLTKEVFVGHLQEAYARAVDHREVVALVMVRIVNHEYIRRRLGDPVAEQSLLRGVVKLHRILRDVDSAGRVGTASFGLLLEGVATRENLTERMVRLIASGLIPLPGLTPPVTLQFHVVGVLLHENPVPPETALDKLDALLDAMSPQTRRPIRFLEPVPTQAGALQSDMPTL